jgi:prepilin signal peptidase PulO-like enzyme (type II secretory pathway)
VKADNASLGELLGDVTRDLSTLMRQEVELAKAELKQSTSRAGKGAGMLAGAGVGGHFVLLFLSLALMWALGAIMPLGWSALIVAVIWAIIAAVLASIGRKELKQIKGLPQTGETLSEIPPTLKPGEVNR